MQILGYDVKWNKRSGIDPSIQPDDDRWYSPLLDILRSSSGVVVSADSALTSSPVYTCVKIISETVAATPLILYEREKKGRGRERADSETLFHLLRTRPNRHQTALEFREMLTAHYLLRGNAYAQIVRSKDGTIIELMPLHPAKMKIKRVGNGDILYFYREDDAETGRSKERIFTPFEIFHLRDMSDDGINGISRVTKLRELIGLGLTMQEFLSTFFGNQAAPVGAVKYAKGQLTDKARSNLKKSWRENYGGSRNAGNVVIFDEGMEWQQIGLSGQDAKFIESKQIQREDVIAIFRVPPHLAGDLTRATFSNIEHQGLNFLTYTMLPHFTRWELAIHRDLIDAGESFDIRRIMKQRLFAEFLISALLRGDVKSRNAAYAVGRQWGWLSANDVRDMENLNPLPEEIGGIYLTPMNMQDVSRINEDPKTGGANDSNDSNADDPSGQQNSARSVLVGSAEGLLNRLWQNEINFLNRYLLKANPLSIEDVLERLDNKRDAKLSAAFSPIFRNYLDVFGMESSEIESFLGKFEGEILKKIASNRSVFLRSALLGRSDYGVRLKEVGVISLEGVEESANLIADEVLSLVTSQESEV